MARCDRFVAYIFFASSLLAQETGLVAKWSFEDAVGSTARDSATGSDDNIVGPHWSVPGVFGSALQFDGYTTRIVRSAKIAPALVHEFTIETWVALDAYPWNWVPIVDHKLDNQSGYAFGIDAYGHLGLQAAAGDAWQTLTSEPVIQLKRWTHIAGTFHAEHGLALYVDGRRVAQLAARGDLVPAERTDLLIGRIRRAALPVPSALIHPKDPVWYSLEGSLDELSIYSRCLADAEIARAFASAKPPDGLSSRWAIFPSGPAGAGPFGAFYTTLKFDKAWDATRRIGPESDVVVRFEQSPMRLVFWQGNSYVPAWVTENGKWYTDEFLEAYGKPNCPDGEDCEPMSDKQNRYSRVRILESTPARAVVHWRYALSETENYKGSDADPDTGWFDWADEYWTVYPDGVAVREQVLWSSDLDPEKHEFQESIVLNGPGQRPEDNINYDAVVLANLKGESAAYRWLPKTEHVFDYPHGPAAFPKPEKANIQWINLKSTWKPFQIAPGDPIRFTAYNGEKTFSAFEWWNHWPVAQIPSSGRPALAPDRPSHTSLSHIYWPVYSSTGRTITKILMDGLTTKPASQLAPLAKSWLTPPPLEITGVQSEGYDPSQRAYVLVCDSPALNASMTLRGTPESPIVNPAFIVKNWMGAARVKVNGQSSGIRTGVVTHLDRSDLVIWIQRESNGPLRIELEREK